MKFSGSAVVLATMAAGQAVASSFSHNMPKHNHAARHVEKMRSHEETRAMAKRDLEHIQARDINNILSLGVKALGVNAGSKNGGVWIGTDGAYTNEFINQGAEDLVLVVWGPWGSWVNAVAPQITISIPHNTSKTLSFADGYSGAWAPIYSDTKIVNGQVSETWGEFTFGQWGVVDVSREVNMKGKNMSIVTPTCITDMERCVFVCPNGQTVCTFGYELLNCGPDSQPGANYGLFQGSPSGGCGNMGSSAHLKTYLNWK